MAQNITLLGASYTAVPAVTLPKTGGGTAKFSDTSVTTAVESDVAEGKTFLLADGSIGIGTASGGGGDEPSEPTYETYFDDSITIDAYISIPSLADLYFAEGETWRVTWDGVEYLCDTTEYQGWLWTVGNQSLATATDDGVNEPFLLYNYGSGAMNGNARTGGTHTLKLEKQTSSGSGGGGSTSSWTKVAETSYQISTTNTAVQTVATWATGSSDLWTSSKWVYVRIRDTAGKREGYYYGGDQFFYNVEPINSSASTYVGTAINMYIRYSASGFSASTSTIASLYGVYADRLYSNGDLRIRSRYHSTNSLTINGTFKVEVYLLDPAGGVPIFE